MLSLRGQSLRLPFHHLTQNEGLSNTFNSFIQRDSRGFVWISSLDGLNRFDGLSVKVYRSNKSDSTTIAGNIVTSKVFEDSLGNLWFSTYGAINCYIRKKDSFRSFVILDDEGKAFTADYYAFHLSEEGQLWVRVGIGEMGRLYFFDIKSYAQHLAGALDGQRVVVHPLEQHGQFQLFSYLFNGKNGIEITELKNGKVASQKAAYDRPGEAWLREQHHTGLYIESDTTWWLGVEEGLARYHPHTGQYRHWSSYDGSTLGRVHDIIPLDERYFFAGCGLKGGLFLFDREIGAIVKSYRPDPDQPYSIARDFANALYLDEEGVLWATIWNVGVDYASIYKNKFDILLNGEQLGLPKADVRQICQDKEGNIWCGTERDGIFIFDENQQLKHRLWGPTGFSPSRPRVGALFSDAFGNIWAGARDELYRYEGPTEQPAEQILLPSRIRDVSQSRDGSLLLGLNYGVRRLERQNGAYVLDTIPGIGNLNLTVTRIFEDESGRLYLSVNADQLQIYEPKGNTYSLIAQYKGVGYTWDFYEPNRDTIWLATSAGLALITDVKQAIQALSPGNGGLPNENYYGIETDNSGHFWLSSNNGLVRYHPHTKSMKRYLPVDGAQGFNFYASANLRTRQGVFWFGGNQGVNIFVPDQIEPVPNKAKVQFTNIWVNSEPLQDTIAVGELAQLDLAYYENTIAFHFVALDYSDPGNNHLEYRLINQDPDNRWVKADARGQARYANLGSGRYTFEVRASNSDGVLNETPTRLDILIRKPFWETTWFKALMVLISFLIIWAIVRSVIRRRLAAEETRRLKELDEFKNRLYQNITHEFRTPLTVIMGMADQIMGNEQPKNLIQRNSKNMLSLINQILDLSKVESGRMELDLVQSDVVDFLQYVAESFHSLADQKNIRLVSYSEEDKLLMDYDEEKLQQIASNLLSNAIKFTDVGGKIVLHLSKITGDHPQFKIVVKDNGIGIPADQLPHIFDRFYQTKSEDKKQRKSKGTGVGLTLTKELVELMGGTISVESQDQKGTTFKILLPVTNNAPLQKQTGKAVELPAIEKTEEPKKESLQPIDPDAPIALLVDDNPDIITYIESCIKPNYRILSANDGQAGIDIALEHIPDIIISDVMMPKKDGFELCHTLKTDPRTSHIPIILLTAKSAADDRVTGLQKGADAYLTKPFHKEELKVRLDKLVELRRQLQERYSGLSQNPISTKEPTPEEIFLSDLYKVVNERMGDPDLGVVDLCRAVHLSHTQVYRKLKALTDKTPSQFIRAIRLQKGLELLKTTHDPVSAIAYDVGFNDPNYFSRMFQETYGQTPSSVRE